MTEDSWIFDTAEGTAAYNRFAEVMETVVLPFDVAAKSKTPSKTAELRRSTFGEFSLVSCDVPDIFSGHCRQIIQRGLRDRAVIGLVVSGSHRMHDSRRTAVVETGGVFILDGDCDAQIDVPHRVRTQLLVVPRTLVISAGQAATGPLAEDSPTTRILRSHMKTLAASLPDLTDSESALAAEATSALIRLATGAATVERTQPGSSLRKTLLPAVTDFVEAHLTDHRLDAAMLAAEFNVSIRTVHAIFEQTGESLGAFIGRRRLEGLRSDITSYPDIPIAISGARWGYTNPSSLARAFREQFSISPRQWRQGNKVPLRQASGPTSAPRRDAPR